MWSVVLGDGELKVDVLIAMTAGAESLDATVTQTLRIIGLCPSRDLEEASGNTQGSHYNCCCCFHCCCGFTMTVRTFISTSPCSVGMVILVPRTASEMVSGTCKQHKQASKRHNPLRHHQHQHLFHHSLVPRHAHRSHLVGRRDPCALAAAHTCGLRDHRGAPRHPRWSGAG